LAISFKLNWLALSAFWSAKVLIGWVGFHCCVSGRLYSVSKISVHLWSLVLANLGQSNLSGFFLWSSFWQVTLSKIKSVSMARLFFRKSGFQKSAFRFISVGLVSVLICQDFLVVAKVKGSCNNLVRFAALSFLGKESCKSKACQQSVQPTGGIRRHLQAFFWLRVFPALGANLVPPTSG